MPVYTYRREDGTTFDIRQKFSDDPLETCPTTGQQVTRVVHAAGVIFKGSGFYVTDNGGHKSAANGNGSNGTNGKHEKNGSSGASESKSETKSEASKEKAPASSD